MGVVSNNCLLCVLLSILYMFKPSCWPMFNPLPWDPPSSPYSGPRSQTLPRALSGVISQGLASKTESQVGNGPFWVAPRRPASADSAGHREEAARPKTGSLASSTVPCRQDNHVREHYKFQISGSPLDTTTYPRQSAAREQPRSAASRRKKYTCSRVE